MLKAAALLAILASGISCARAASPYVESYRGDFTYSWEGGGFFIPCEAGPNQPHAALGRRFFADLHADSIHWPAGVAPDRTHEGAATFVMLRTPRLGRGGSDTVAGVFGAQVDSARPRTARDCRAAQPNER